MVLLAPLPPFPPLFTGNHLKLHWLPSLKLSGAHAARALYFTQFPPRLYMLCHHSDAHAAFVLHAADG